MLAWGMVFIYLLGFFFSLGFWLEQSQGKRLGRPFLTAVLWPLTVLIVAFSAGCKAGRG